MYFKYQFQKFTMEEKTQLNQQNELDDSIIRNKFRNFETEDVIL